MLSPIPTTPGQNHLKRPILPQLKQNPLDLFSPIYFFFNKLARPRRIRALTPLFLSFFEAAVVDIEALLHLHTVRRLFPQDVLFRCRTKTTQPMFRDHNIRKLIEFPHPHHPSNVASSPKPHPMLIKGIITILLQVTESSFIVNLYFWRIVCFTLSSASPRIDRSLDDPSFMVAVSGKFFWGGSPDPTFNASCAPL